MLNRLFGWDTTPPIKIQDRVAPVDQLNDNIVLGARLDALEIACAAMWQLLKSKHGLKDEELVTIIHMLDAKDGKADGRVTPGPEVCPTCGRQLITRQRKRCIWCGADLPTKPF